MNTRGWIVVRTRIDELRTILLFRSLGDDYVVNGESTSKSDNGGKSSGTATECSDLMEGGILSFG